jgi:hypothetical protein
MLAASINKVTALMMEAASTYATEVNLYQTTECNNPEDGHLHTCHCRTLNLTSGSLCVIFVCSFAQKFFHLNMSATNLSLL